MRKLATIQVIKKVTPLENADTLEVATVLGWNVVVKKKEFFENQKCLFIEPDSFLPIHPVFDFMEKNGRKTMEINGETREGYRLRTIRLRGQVSQGLILSIEELLSLINVEYQELRDLLENFGEDISEGLGIYKYESPIPSSLSGEVKGPFPSFISKTDETRLQSVPEIINRNHNKLVHITEKIDGSSTTIYMDNGELNVCSRNLNLKESDKNSFWRIANKLNLKEKMKRFNDDIVLQGELVGPGINGNKLKLKELDLYVFNVYSRKLNTYLDVIDAKRVLDFLDIKQIPILGSANLTGTVSDWVKLATIKSTINPDVWAEGIVVKSFDSSLVDFETGRLSFKVINPEFLLEYKE